MGRGQGENMNEGNHEARGEDGKSVFFLSFFFLERLSRSVEPPFGKA